MPTVSPSQILNHHRRRPCCYERRLLTQVKVLGGGGGGGSGERDSKTLMCHSNISLSRSLLTERGPRFDLLIDPQVTVLSWKLLPTFHLRLFDRGFEKSDDDFLIR